MLNRDEAVVLIAIIETYSKQLEKIMSAEDYDIITSLARQIQNRLELKEKLTF